VEDVTDLSTVSSDDVIESYRKQLSDAHHLLAITEARLAKALKMLNERPSETPRPSPLEIDFPVEQGA
jgi:hypothetical protein